MDPKTLEFSLGTVHPFPVEVPKGVLLIIPDKYLSVEQINLQHSNDLLQEGILDHPDTESTTTSLSFASSSQTVDSRVSLKMANREWEVKAILDHRESETVYETTPGTYEPIWEFLVRWRYLGGSYDNTWLEEGLFS